jgi:hypothetical protein
MPKLTLKLYDADPAFRSKKKSQTIPIRTRRGSAASVQDNIRAIIVDRAAMTIRALDDAVLVELCRILDGHGYELYGDPGEFPVVSEKRGRDREKMENCLEEKNGYTL